MIPAKFTLNLVFIASAISMAFTMNCYQCNSILDPKCTNLMDYAPHEVIHFYKLCPEKKNGKLKPFCRTATNEMKFMKHNRVVRSCGYEKADKECYRADNDHHLEEVCQCFNDGCNVK